MNWRSGSDLMIGLNLPWSNCVIWKSFIEWSEDLISKSFRNERCRYDDQISHLRSPLIRESRWLTLQQNLLFYWGQLTCLSSIEISLVMSTKRKKDKRSCQVGSWFFKGYLEKFQHVKKGLPLYCGEQATLHSNISFPGGSKGTKLKL